MPEHAHLLLIPPEGSPLAPVLKSLKLSIQQRVLRLLRESGDPLASDIVRADGTSRFWLKGGGFDRNVRNEAELHKAIRYIHRNPVSRALVATPLGWRWSSARWWTARHRGAQQDPSDVPCDWPPGDPRAWAMWQGFM